MSLSEIIRSRGPLSLHEIPRSFPKRLSPRSRRRRLRRGRTCHPCRRPSPCPHHRRLHRPDLVLFVRRDSVPVSASCSSRLFAPLTVVVVAPGFDVEPPADSVVWKGDKANASFLLTARADVADGPCAGTAKIMSGSIPIAFLHFQLRVGSSGLGKTRLEATEQAIRTVFASYASADRAEVIQWARGAEVAGVDVFLDVLKLRESD